MANNRLVDRSAKVSAYEPKCLDCNDFGYTLPAIVAKRYQRDIPAGALFREGHPCHCAAGRHFAERQAEWRKPIQPRPPVEAA